jgi:hypothetical protein
MPHDLSGRVPWPPGAGACLELQRGAEPLVIRKVIGDSELCGTNRRKVIGEIYDEADEPELRSTVPFKPLALD